MVHLVTPYRRGDVRAIEPFQREMNRLFDSLFSDFPVTPSTPGSIVPAMDVDETPDAWIIQLEVPGLDPKDVQITVTGNELVVRGETKRAEDSAETTAFHRERRFGSFQRSLTLPSNVASDQVKATCRNGVLELTLPKKAESKPRSIQIEVK